MEQKINLNTTDEWENIVNANADRRASARTRRAKREIRLDKLFLSALVFLVTGGIFQTLGAAGAVADWLANLVAIVSLIAGSFEFGRYVEAMKR